MRKSLPLIITVLSAVAIPAAMAAPAAPVAIGQTVDRHAPTPFATSSWTPSQNAHVPGLPAANGVGLQKHLLDLNLTSSSTDISLKGILSPVRTLMLNLGGTLTPFNGKDSVTAAEYVAIKQLLAPHGTQSLLLDGSGIAVGGSLSLNGLISPVKVSSLDIPSGVVALDNAAKNRLLGISGDLTNNGSIYIYSTLSRSTITGLLLANNIYNNGLITSTPDSVLASLLPNNVVVAPHTNVTLAAITNLANTGVIQSSGKTLLATAYGAISNISSPSNPYTTQAAIISNNDLAFSSGRVVHSTSPVTFTNSGLIASSLGSVSFWSVWKAADLIFNFNGGLVQASAGSINVRDQSFTGSGNVLFNGGTYSSLGGLNVNGGTGNITANATANALTSAINTNALRTLTSGNVDIVNNSDAGVTLFPSTAHNFSLLNSGSVDLSGITATGNVNVVADYALGVNNTHLNVASGGSVTTSNGSITLQNADGATGTIMLGLGSTVGTHATSGTDGSVRIVAGDIPTTPVLGTAPGSGVHVNDISNDGVHKVYWGDNSITAFAPVNTLNIKGQDIIFEAATSASQITLQGMVNITADPVACKTAMLVDDEYVVETDGE